MCTTCKVCRGIECKDPQCSKPIETLNSTFLPATHQEVLDFLCENCREGILCQICDMKKPPSAFGESAKHHRGAKHQNIRCLDCANPACNAIGCTTCKVCRNVACRSRNNRCTKQIQTLNSNILPGTHKDVLDFFCERCRFIRCSVKKNRRKPL